MAYVELHCHSAFSFLDGASLPDELAQAALAAGHHALALTDHDSVSGSMEFAVAAKALGLRAIHGAEITLEDGRHLTLLVEDKRGWSNLCRILTRSHAQTRAGPRREAREPAAPLTFVLDHAEGLVCLSGCAARGVHDEPSLRVLLDAFGRDGLRIELQRPFLQGDRARNRRLEALARRLEVPVVATGNVHAHSAARARLQDALVAIGLGMPLDACEAQRRGNHSHVLTTPAAMAARFPDHPEAVAGSARLAERLRFDLQQDLGYRYPGAENANAQRDLAELCQVRLDRRYPRGTSLRGEATARLEQELRVIDGLGLAGFFLIHHEMLELAREVALEVRGPDSARSLLPPGRGRGSSVSSIVCYLTGLSHVDPVANRLLLGRFLSEGLEELPDIDLDFPRDIREVLIPRVHERYGHDRSALVAAFPTYRARGAIRELGKALGLPPAEIERVARGSEGWSARDVGRDIAAALGERRPREGRWMQLAELAGEAHGLPRHLSQHSGGMVVATRPLIDCCPIVPAAMEGRQVVQWDKDSCADGRLLKIDLLGLGMLSCVERCVELIAREHRRRVDLSRIPFDDPETFSTIQRGDTIGVFQIESRAQISSLLRTRPETLDELTIQVAIVRPGPIQGGAVNPYIDRLRRRREDPSFEVPYEHPSLAPVLADTLGAIIFQDQVLDVAMAFAGFTSSQADGLRRAMSRKRSEEALEAHHERFCAGAKRLHGVDHATAERVWGMISGFSGFGFPKAHGAAFGLLAYQSTWLRVHYPAEFLCALLNEQPMGFYSPDALIHDAQRHGLEVRPPDVQASDVECSVEEGAVRVGLGYVAGVVRDEVEALVVERRRRGPFRGLEDLTTRVGAGTASLEQLAWSGACDGLADGDRRRVLWRLGIAVPGRRVPGGTQLSLPLDLPAAPELAPLGAWRTALADYASAGLTTGTHPLELLRSALPAGTCRSAQLPKEEHGRRVVVAGLVVARQRPGTASGIAFMLIEDETGTINLVVPRAIYERHRLTVRTEPLVLAEGRLERPPAAGGGINVLVDRIAPIEAPDLPVADVHEIRPSDEQPQADDFRAVAPPAMSFASGRRR